MKQKFFFLLFIFSLGLLAQAPKDTKTVPESSKNSPEKKDEGKPVKMETGTVTLDPAAVSGDFKRTNLRNLKKMKSSFLNNGGEEKFKLLTKDYVDANIKFQERNFVSSRRLFEQNNKDINTEAEIFAKKYFDLYNKLYSEASTQLVDFKINSKEEESISPTLEKYLVSANEFFTNAQALAVKKNHIDALTEYKSALQNIFKVFQTINKFKNRKLTVTEHYQNNLLIDEDYIQKENLKDYDDSYGNIFVDKEKEREKEREQIKKGIVNKLGELKPVAKVEKEDPKKDAKQVTEPAKK